MTEVFLLLLVMQFLLIALTNHRIDKLVKRIEKDYLSQE